MNKPQVPMLYVINGLLGGGAEFMLYKLLKHYDRERFPSTVVSLIREGRVAPMIRDLGVKVIALDVELDGKGGVGGLWRLVRIIREIKPALIQGWMYHGNFAALIGGYFGGCRNVLWNLRCSDMEDGHGSRSAYWLKVMLAKLAGRPRAVIVNSPAGKAYHEGIGYRPRRWELIPNGFDCDVFKPDPSARAKWRSQLGLSPDIPVVGMVARWHPMKDHATFIAAARIAVRKIPAVQFVLCGKEITEDNALLMALIRNNDLMSRFHLLGERTEVAEIYCALDIAVHSSAYGEGFQNVIGEAMACGVPCVVTDVGAAPEIVSDTDDIIPPRDAEALGTAMLRLLNLPESRRRERGARGRERIIVEYNLRKVVDRYVALYEELAAGRRPATH